MGDQPNGGFCLAARGCGQKAVHITVPVHPHALKAQLPHLGLQLPGQIELAGGGGVGFTGLAGSGVYPDVFQKAFICAHVCASFFYKAIVIVAQAGQNRKGGARAQSLSQHLEKWLFYDIFVIVYNLGFSPLFGRCPYLSYRRPF